MIFVNQRNLKFLDCITEKINYFIKSPICHIIQYLKFKQKVLKLLRKWVKRNRRFYYWLARVEYTRDMVRVYIYTYSLKIFMLYLFFLYYFDFDPLITTRSIKFMKLKYKINIIVNVYECECSIHMNYYSIYI